MTQTYDELFSATEAKYGLPAGYLKRTAHLESTTNPNAKNPDSSAGGLFQFIDGTAKAYNLRNRYNPYEATDAAGRLARDNMGTLRKVLGREPTGAELYLAHQQGGGGASKLLGDPNALVGGDEIALNGGQGGMTAGAFASQWINKFNGGGGEETGNVPIFDNPYGGEFGQEGDVPVNPASYLGIDAPTGPDVFQQQLARDEGPQPFGSWGEEITASLENSLTSQSIRWMSEDYTDPDFKLDEDRYVALTKEMPDNYHNMILGAGSEKDLLSRLKFIEEDVVRQQRLQEGGWSGTTAMLAGGLMDPVGMVAGVTSGGWGIAAKGGWVARSAIGAGAGAATNVAIDQAAAMAFDDPHSDPLMAAVVGAGFGTLGGILSRNKATQDIAHEAFRSEHKTAQQALSGSTALTSPVIGGNLDSVGAARNTSLFDSLLPGEQAALWDVSDHAVDYAVGKGLRFDTAGQMSTSDDPLVRLLGPHLFEETVGFKNHGVVPDSVNSQYTAYHRKVTGNFQIEYQPAKSAFIKEKGIGILNMRARSNAETEFNQLVAAYIRDPNPPPNTSPHIVKGAGAARKMFNQIREDMNGSDLSSLDADPHYLPLVARHDHIAKINQEVPSKNIEELLRQAILKHTPTLSKELSGAMAQGYWAVIRKAGYGISDPASGALQIGDKKAFRDTFIEALGDTTRFSEKQIDEVFDKLTGALDIAGDKGKSAKGVSHLKKRTLMDYSHKATVLDRNNQPREISILDLFDNDAELLAKRYSRNMSGRIAFARMQVHHPVTGDLIIDGIRTTSDLDRVKDGIRESYRLRDEKGEFRGKDSDLANQLENVDFAWKRINGIPVWNNQASYNQWARRLKTAQFIRLMSNMGLNQVQEGWKLMTLVGFKAATSQMPAIRTMVSGINAGKFKADKLLTELTDMTGMGLDALWNKFDARLVEERVGYQAGSKFTQKVDQVLDAGQQLTSQISLMRSIMDYQQRWAMKAITQQMADTARKTSDGVGGFDFSKVKLRDRQRLASMGIGDDDAKTLFKDLLAHSEFKGKKITGVNIDKWDPATVSKYRTFLTRYTDRLVQSNDYGALSKIMSQPVASMFFQFRSFVMGAWTKSTLWSLHHGGLKDPKIFVLLMGEIAAGSATYMIRAAPKLVTEDGRDKWEEEMTTANIIKNGWARTATASILPMLADTALMASPFDPQFGNARASGSPTDALFGSPAVDQVGSAFKFTKVVGKSLIDGEDLTKSEINSGIRSLPLPMNWLPVTAGLGALIKDRK